MIEVLKCQFENVAASFVGDPGVFLPFRGVQSGVDPEHLAVANPEDVFPLEVFHLSAPSPS